jgi:hypothetical protein
MEPSKNTFTPTSLKDKSFLSKPLLLLLLIGLVTPGKSY